MRNNEEISHRGLFRLAWPITVGMLSHTAMAVADTLFVGWMGTEPLAAVGLAIIGSHLVGAGPMGLYGGVRVRIAHAIGGRRPAHARRLAWQGLWMVLPFAALAWLLVPLAAPFLHVMGAQGAVVDHGASFLSARLFAMPLLFVFCALQAWFDGRGETRVPMAAVLLGNAVNIVLDPVLIYGFGPIPAFGVAGASIATGFAWAVEVVLLAAFCVRALAHRVSAPDRAALAEVVSTGAPMGVHFALDVFAYVFFASLLAGSGDVHVAAHIIVVRILAVSFLPGHSLAQAAGVLVGQTLGAGRPGDARRSFGLATLQASAFMTAMGGVFLLVPGPLVAVFGAEAEVAELAVGVLGLAAFVQVFDAVGMVAFGALNGAGDTRFTMGVGLAVSWLVKLPVAAFGVAIGLGVWGAWFGIAAEIVVMGLVGLWRIRGEAWLGSHGGGLVAAAEGSG